MSPTSYRRLIDVLTTCVYWVKIKIFFCSTSAEEINVEFVLLTKASRSEEDLKMCILATNYIRLSNLVQYGKIFPRISYFAFVSLAINKIAKYE